MAEPKSRGGRDITVERLVEDFLAHCRAKNLSPRTVEWYGFKYRAFVELVPRADTSSGRRPRHRRSRGVLGG